MTLPTPTARSSGALRRAGGAAVVDSFAFAGSLVTGPLLARSLGDAGRGQLAAVVVTVQLVGWTLLLGIPYAASVERRRRPIAGIRRDAALAGLVATGLVAIPAALVVPTVLDRLDDPARIGMAVGLAAVGLMLPAGVALRLELAEKGNDWWYGVRKNLYLFLFTPTVLVLWLAGRLTLGSAVATWVGAVIVQSVVNIANGGGLVRPARSVAGLRSLLLVGRGNAVANGAQVILGRIDQLALAAVAPLADLGLYAVAATAAQVSLPASKALADSAFFHGARRDGEGERLERVTLVASVLASTAVAVVAPVAIPLLFGTAFEGSVPLLWLLLPGQVAFNVGFVVGQRHDAEGDPGVLGWALGTATAVFALLVLPVAERWSGTGAAALTSGCQALFLLLVVAIGRRRR